MKPPQHPRVPINLKDGRIVEAVAPFIISASRATDIPAFFPQWFMDHLDKGFVEWINPFNGKIQYVSFENCRLIVFWSKNPTSIFPFLEKIDKKGLHYFFHITVNDYEKEGFEPGVPPLDRRIESLIELTRRIGSKRIVWRFDPLVFTSSINPELLLERIRRIGDRIAAYVCRLTISFLSPYRAVLNRMRRRHIMPIEPPDEYIERIGTGLAIMMKDWGIEIVTCAESRSLGKWGILPGSCIDPVFIKRNFYSDTALTKLIEDAARNIFLDDSFLLRARLKDPGQRPLCNCMISKDIGRYNTCLHKCIYCYALKGD